MLKSYKLPLSFDSAPLKRDLERIPAEAWTRHFNARYYEGEWSGVSLRAGLSALNQLYPDPDDPAGYCDTEMLDLCPHIREVLAGFRCPLKSVRLLKLAPGSRILEHRDYKLGYEEGEVRLHIPVRTNERVEFYLDGRRLVLKEGECWFIDFNFPHRVFNHGADERIHLVLDCVVNDWLKSLIPFEDEDCEDSSFMVADGRGETTRESFERFRQTVLQDETLQESLRETSDVKTFVTQVVRLGHDLGHHFTAADVEEALRASRRAWLERWL
ncbi:MAG TPA: aspartyl/asparaginyl beta-hydroxylase domain-containing protein [Pyrinomonadaceae bacterium]|nr:aspartyl/asparaginyl beta-hydroxylase domain-containing protein [Pyrinomonadaceae bacterium]